MKFLIKNFRKFKIITFDCTNTLLYFKKSPEIIYLDYARKCGLSVDTFFDQNLMKINFRKMFKELNLSHPNYGRYSGLGHEKWWRQLVTGVFQSSVNPQGAEISQSKLDEVAGKLIQAFTTDECWGKFAKSDDLIRDLKSAGKCVGIISNFDPRLHQLLVNVNLPKFDFVITSYEAECEKPKSEIFEKAIKASKIDCEPQEALHIGNEDKDYDGAKGAGWSAVLLNSDDAEKSQFKDIPDFYEFVKTKDMKF